MVRTTNLIPQHVATLQCVWVFGAQAGQDAPLSAVWIDTHPILPIRTSAGILREANSRISGFLVWNLDRELAA